MFAGAVLVFPQHKSYLKAHYRAGKAAEGLGMGAAGVWPLHNLPPGHTSQASSMCDAISKLKAKLQQDAVLLNSASSSFGDASKQPAMKEALGYNAFVCTLITSAVNIIPQLPLSSPAPIMATEGAEQVHASRLKEEGNHAFASKNPQVAISKWLQAVTLFPLIPVILNNLSAAFIKQGMPVHAVHAAAVVLAFKPSDTKALARASTAAIQIDWQSQALRCAELGLQHDPSNTELLSLRSTALKNVSTGVASSSTDQHAADTPVGGFMSESEVHEIETAGHVEPEKLTMMRNMFQMMAHVCFRFMHATTTMHWRCAQIHQAPAVCCSQWMN